MHHKIIDALSNIVTPERLVIYKDSVSILLLKDLSVYDLIFDNFYDSMFESDSVSNVADFDNLLVGNLRGLIEEFSVYIDMDMVDANAVEPLTYLAKMLYNYDQYDDHRELLLMLDQEVPSTELIGEMVASITQYNKPVVIMQLVNEVSRACLKRMRTVSMECLESQDNVSEYTQDELIQIERLAKLSTLFGTRRPLDLLQAGWKFGRPLEEYADELVVEDNEIPADQQAKLFVLAAIMANVPNDQIRSAVGEYVQSRYDERAEVMTAIGRALGRLDFGA
jgi:hypothetical protein